LEYPRPIWNMLWPLGNFVVIWYICPRFGILYQRKIWQPWFQDENRSVDKGRTPGLLFCYGKAFLLTLEQELIISDRRGVCCALGEQK
jgi:hypothetical protein